MVAAFTTAAVINFSMGRPEDGVSPLDYMPSHKSHKAKYAHPERSPEELAALSDYNARVLTRAIALKKKNNG